MIVMDLQIDNFFSFKKFHLNFSYPKKIVGNTLGDEELSFAPNFRYKKINIIMGANATGKTSLGRMLNLIFEFIADKNFSELTQKVANPKKVATFSVDLVLNDRNIYRLKCQILPSADGKYTTDNIWVSVVSTNVSGDDSYEKCRQRLNDLMQENFVDDYIRELEKIGDISCMFEYPFDIDSTFEAPFDEEFFVKVANNVMKALDPSIKSFEKLDAVKDGYVIHTETKDVVFSSGQRIDDPILSSGTKAGIGVASILSGLLRKDYGFYYCDEKFSYIGSEIEKAVLAVMINSISDDQQLFFTTHNVEILDMDLPKHSFLFMKKETENDNKISCLWASDVIKRNTDSLRRAVENDLFSCAPSVDLIYEIENMKGTD